jgi:hypothetical protein
MPEIRPEYMVNLKGKQHPLYAGVLVCAHENGLLGIEVSVTQYPTAENGHLAVCQAIVTMRGEDGRELVFTEIGDASPTNVGSMIAPHICRMAATRAKGRALRDALALGIALVEEMGPDTEPENGHRGGSAAATARSAPRSEPRATPAPQTPSAASDAVCSAEGCGVLLNEGEVKTCKRYFPGHPLVCKVHAKERAAAIKAAEGVTHGVG